MKITIIEYSVKDMGPSEGIFLSWPQNVLSLKQIYMMILL